MKYADLPKRAKYGVMLYCRACGGEYSALAGDYFMQDITDEIICGNCNGELLQLVHKRVTFGPLKQEAAE